MLVAKITHKLYECLDCSENADKADTLTLSILTLCTLEEIARNNCAVTVRIWQEKADIIDTNTSEAPCSHLMN